MMRAVRTIACGTFVVAAFVVAAAIGQAQEPPAAAPAADGKVDPAELYKQNCMACHGPDGNSAIPNASFADGVWVHGSSLAEVTTTITNGATNNGVQTAMMPFKERLTKEQIAALAKYVRQFDKKLKSTK